MAHEIRIIGNRADIAYAGETPWHGLGQQLDPSADMTTWAEAAGFNFEIENVPALYMSNDGLLRAYPNRRTLLRSDTKEALSIVSSGYKVVQPAEVLDFFKDVIATGGYQMDVAGVLFNGARYWALAKVNDGFELAGGDKIAPYLLLATGCDLQLATTGMLTWLRTVCNNTIQMNLVNAEGGRIKRHLKIPHSRQFDPEELKRELGLVETSIEDSARKIQQFSDRRLSDREALAFFATILRTEKEKEQLMADLLVGAASQEQDNIVESLLNGDFTKTTEEREAEVLLQGSDKRTVQAMYQLYNGNGMGSQMESSAGTLWGAINAVTEQIDHHRNSHSTDTRLNNAWFGNGANLKEKAWEAAVGMI